MFCGTHSTFKPEKCVIMCHQQQGSFLILCVYLFASCEGWRAVPMNHAKYALRDSKSDYKEDRLKKDYQHSVYRMGFCTPDAIAPVFLRKKIHMKVSTRTEAMDTYIYLLSNKHTINIHLQCVVMRIFTNRLFALFNSRFPLYYCQGNVHYLMMNSIQRIEIHEFFLGSYFRLPADITFEFYHPTLL